MTNIFMASVKSAVNLAQVQAGFSSVPDISTDDLTYIIIMLLVVVFLVILLSVFNIRKRRSRRNKGWLSITNSQTIWEIITRAVSRQAHFILEIYQPSQTITYKGFLESLEGDTYLILSLSEMPSVEADFSGLPGVMHINFRAGPKESMDHYQFATKVVSNRFVRHTGWREAQLVLPLPKVITSAQRRNFLRLEPVAEFAFDCRLTNVPEGNIPSLEAMEEVCSGQIMDISIGGAQIKLTSTVTLRETQRLVGVMFLPLGGLNLELDDPTLVLLMQILSQEHVQGSEQFGQEAHVLLRVRFLGRYVLDKLQNFWVYRGLTQTTLQDLSYWMQAYQRHFIKKKLNLLPPDENKLRPPNMFPSSPPVRPPLRGDDD